MEIFKQANEKGHDGEKNAAESLKNAKNAAEKLNKYLTEGMYSAFELAYHHTGKYFESRSSYKPRITIKAPYNPNKIVDLFRKDKSPFSEFDVNENSAFEYIKDTGKFYICNDIPDSIMKEKYNNKRINGQTVRSNSLAGQPESDPAWERCWDIALTTRPHTESCYKSTLVIPMTLVNARLGTEFKRCLFGDEGLPEMENKYNKLMFGFLCFDHRHTGYFNHESDIKFGYVIADMLSLFLIIRMICTTKCENAPEARHDVIDDTR